MRSDIYFKHDLYAVQNDRELRKVCKAYPVWGEAVYFAAVVMMYREDGEDYDADNLVDDVADELYTDNTDKVAEIISLCVSVGLFKIEGNFIFSDRVKRTCEAQKDFRNKQSEKGKKSAEKRAQERENLKNSSTTVEPQLNSGSTYNQDQDQDQDQNQDQKNIPSSLTTFESMVGGQMPDTPTPQKENTDLFGEKIEAEPERVPYKDITDRWNKCLKGKLPQIRILTEDRKVLIKQRWYEYHEDVFVAIEKAAASEFLSSWKACGFDWCFQKKNMIKILEGNYDTSPKKRRDRKNVPSDLNGQYDDYKEEAVTEL